MKTKYFTLAAVAMMLAACSSDETMHLSDAMDTPISLTANVSGLTATRTTTEDVTLNPLGLFVTTENTNDKYKATNQQWAYGDVVTEGATEKKWTATDGTLLFEGTGKQSASAYHPYSADITASTFNYTTDGATDLLWWNTGADKLTSSSLTIDFAHALSKLTVNLKKNEEVVDATLGDVTIGGTILTSTADLTTMKWTAVEGATAADLAATALDAPTSGFDKTVEVLLIPQAAQFSVLIAVGEKVYKWTASSALEFQPGYAYTLNLTVGKEIVKMGQVTVRAWTEELITGGVAEEVLLPSIDLSQYTDGTTVDITENRQIIGDGNEYNIALNIAEDATVIFDAGTSGVKLTAPITVADGKTLTLRVKGNAEHTVKGGISLGNGSNVIIEGDLTQENNKLTVTSSGGNAGIGANGGVTAGDITIRNARVDATGSTSDSSQYYMSGAGIGTANASMGNILIENSIVTAAGGYYFSSSSSDPTSHAAAIGMGSSCVTMGNITLIDSEITASNNGDGHASVIGAGSFYHPTATNDNIETVGNMGNIIITSTELNLSMANGPNWFYAAMIGPGLGNSAYSCVNMGKIIFTDVTQAELDEMIATWSIPSDFNQYGAYVLGRGRDGSYYETGDFGGVWVSDGNGGTVPIGDKSGYYDLE